MKKCILRKRKRLASLPNGPRTDIIEGNTEMVPIKGKHFVMTAPPLVSGAYRLVETSRVTAVTKDDNKYTFITESESEYEVEII